MDRAALSRWIGAEHLDDAATHRYRLEFDSHPARLLVLDRFLVDDVAEQLSTFLRCEAEFGSEFGLYSAHDEAVEEPAWQAAVDEDRFFRYGRLVGTPPEFVLSPNALTYLQFRHAFQSDELRAFFETISGLPLGSSDDFGAHAMRAGDFLRPHSDNNRDRQLALVIYLTPGWEPRHGGALHVTDAAGNDTIVEAEYNRVVIFDVLADTLHEVEPIATGTNGAARVTIGGWYRKV